MRRLRDYYTEVVDRAFRTACQSAILVIGADQFNVVSVDWAEVAGFAGGGAVLSLLTTFAVRGFRGHGDDERGEIRLDRLGEDGFVAYRDSH